MIQSEVTSICTAEERLTGYCVLNVTVSGVYKSNQTNRNEINIKQHKRKIVNKNILFFFKSYFASVLHTVIVTYFTKFPIVRT